MTEETTLPIVTDATETAATTEATTASTTEATIPVVTDGVIYEDLSGSEATDAAAAMEEVVIVDVIESVGSDLAHVSLFGSFLVCGTLVGLALLRDRHGN